MRAQPLRGGAPSTSIPPLSSAIRWSNSFSDSTRRAEKRGAFRLSPKPGILPSCRIIAGAGRTYHSRPSLLGTARYEDDS